MDPHVRVVGVLWVAVGVALAAWSIWGLATEEHYASVVQSWLVTFAFAALAIGAGLTFGRTKMFGRALVRTVSGLALLYSLSWLFLGGGTDARSYTPAIICPVA